MTFECCYLWLFQNLCLICSLRLNRCKIEFSDENYFYKFCRAAIAISLFRFFKHLAKLFTVCLFLLLDRFFFLLPFMHLLSLTGNINNIWFCFPIAEIVAVILSVFFLKNIFKNIIESYNIRRKNENSRICRNVFRNYPRFAKPRAS